MSNGNHDSEAKKDSGDNVVSEIKIVLKQDGSISVDGPINNFLLFRHMMNKAEWEVLDKFAEKIFEKENSRIIKPGMKIYNG